MEVELTPTQRRAIRKEIAGIIVERGMTREQATAYDKATGWTVTAHGGEPIVGYRLARGEMAIIFDRLPEWEGGRA